ncbi:hypothetical protein BVRB_7g164900 [Beta vulgaris subsp. vulgaris]|uniref:Uncharacterized protein n=1 Tax=Beta vulgaris subsp. vulgaris TaxID=3555 RepID=A0A0J8C0S0_BETVV|nr:hypothetical protein BVRB_7g164900 [Beta vulgaris subsp. vulgaris]
MDFVRCSSKTRGFRSPSLKLHSLFIARRLLSFVAGKRSFAVLSATNLHELRK